VRTTTRDDTATNAARTECPPWCDPSQHLIDDNDTALVVVHRSRPAATAAMGSPRLQQTVRRFGPRVVRSPVTISVEPIPHVELHDRDETADFLRELTRALVSLTNRAWTAHTSTLAS
jgi:hypothetical protein